MTQYVLTVTEWVNLDGIFEYFRKLKKSYEHHKKVNETIKELSKLSDRELRDIGINRGEIYAIANETHSDNLELNHNLKGWV